MISRPACHSGTPPTQPAERQPGTIRRVSVRRMLPEELAARRTSPEVLRMVGVGMAATGKAVTQAAEGSRRGDLQEASGE